MADYRLVDATQLDRDLTTVADAIREKAGTNEPLAFPDGMAQAVANIPTGGGEDYISKAHLEGTESSVIFPNGLTKICDYAFYGRKKLTIGSIPEGVAEIGMQAFRNAPMAETLTLPTTLRIIRNYAFQSCANIRVVIFKSAPTNLAVGAFNNASITDIYVPWAEGAVEGAPWMATNATIHYNHTGEV